MPRALDSRAWRRPVWLVRPARRSSGTIALAALPRVDRAPAAPPLLLVASAVLRWIVAALPPRRRRQARKRLAAAAVALVCASYAAA